MTIARRVRRSHRGRRSRLAVPACLAIAALACSDAGVEPGAIAAPESDVESAAVVEKALAAVDERPAVETAPAATETIPALPPDPGSTMPAKPARKPRAASATKPDAPPVGHVPLETLLRTSGTSGAPLEPPLDLGELVEESVDTEGPEATSVLEPWKQRVQVERRSEPVGRSGQRQGTYSETEASIRVPVDESVSLEGGVRVDQRSEPDAEKPERESIPRLGVEVRF